MTEHKIIISGFGGQGIVLAGNLLANAALIENKNTVGMVSYGAEVRGGTANSSTIISDSEISSPVIDKPNIVIALNQPSLDKYSGTIEKKGYLVINTSLAKKMDNRDINTIPVPASEIAAKLGNIKAANMVAIGSLIKASKILDLNSVKEALQKVFGSKKNLIELNEKALDAGAENV